MNKWKGYKVFNHQTNSLLVDVNIRLSPPCGNAQQNYNKRSNPINELYIDPRDCNYESADRQTKTHPLYQLTGF